jgi:putative transposase
VARTLTAHDVLTIITALPRGPGELVVVLDNASIHRSQTLQAAALRLQDQGIRLSYLPRYSPELNRIEPSFGVIKHTELPERTYPTVEALRAAIDRAFTRCEQRLRGNMQHELRPAA